MTYFSPRSFHRFSKQHQFLPEEWPVAWKKTYYKEYPRFQTIDLPDAPPEADLFTVIKTRVSHRSYGKIGLTISDIGTLLKYSCGNTQAMVDDEGNDSGRYHRASPSGGARFPIESYLLVLYSVDGLSPGIYHYRVREHRLETLQLRSIGADEVKQILTYEWAWEASVIVFLTAVFWRTENKYGRRGYRYILLEAGHITQNICLISTALGISACPLAGTHDEAVESLLEIDGISESLVYAVALGK